MGVGKWTVGPLLGKGLRRPFVELEEVVRERAGGMWISEIFARNGEAGFRKLEHAALREVAQQPEVVVSLGGGTLHQAQNQSLLSLFQIIVLHAEFEQLQARLSSYEQRPLAAQAEALYHARLSGYLDAGAVVSVGEKSPRQIVDTILEVLSSASNRMMHQG